MGSSGVGSPSVLQRAPEFLPGGMLAWHVVTVTEERGDASGSAVTSRGVLHSFYLHSPGPGPLEAWIPEC